MLHPPVPIESPSKSLRTGIRAVRWLRRLGAVAWAGSAIAVFSLWLQFHSGVYRTHAWLWIPPAAVGLISSVAAVFFGLSKVVFGPRRRTMLGWLIVGASPLLLAVTVVGYMFYMQSQRNLPNSQVHKVGRMAAITLLEGHARLLYPHRLETPHLVMYYDDQVTDPGGDVSAMEVHLARLEALLGRKQLSQIHWVRGSALGMRSMCVHSIALGSESSPGGTLDRHELAHAFLYQFSEPSSEPPMLLLEGWAMAVEGPTEPLARTALSARQQFNIWRGTSETFRSILSPDLYHVGIPHAYEMGGAFVDFLLRKYGPEKFLDFYNAIHPDSFDAECQRVFGCNWDSLEKEFWMEVARSANVGR